MDKVLVDRYIEFWPDTLQEVRKDVDLDQARIDQSLDIIEDWLAKQTHFTRTDYSRDYLERTLITCKGSVERTKKSLDKLCTIKTLMPEYFNVNDVIKELTPLTNKVYSAALPKLTPNHHRVMLYRVYSDFNIEDVCDFNKNVIMSGEYLKHVEYCKGFIVIGDFRDLNLLNILTKVNPFMFAQVLSLLVEGYGMRLKGMYGISNSKTFETVVSVFKPALSSKIGERIHIVNNEDKLYDIVPQDTWPNDFGGKERSLKILSDEWLDILSSSENMERYTKMNTYKIKESHRRSDKFKETYMGMPGSFRSLSVD